MKAVGGYTGKMQFSKFRKALSKRLSSLRPRRRAFPKSSGENVRAQSHDGEAPHETVKVVAQQQNAPTASAIERVNAVEPEKADNVVETFVNTLINEILEELPLTFASNEMAKSSIEGSAGMEDISVAAFPLSLNAMNGEVLVAGPSPTAVVDTSVYATTTTSALATALEEAAMLVHLTIEEAIGANGNVEAAVKVTCVQPQLGVEATETAEAMAATYTALKELNAGKSSDGGLCAHLSYSMQKCIGLK